jgi:hypothetical protein
MAPDPKLVEVARAAEAELALPLLRLSTAGQLIVGVPGPTSRFSEATREPLAREVMARTGQRGAFTSQKKAEALQAHQDEEAVKVREGWAPAAREPEPDPPENLTLYNAILWAWGEPSGLRVPAVRVRLDAVTAWWPTPAEQVKGSGGTGGWFAFVSLPIRHLVPLRRQFCAGLLARLEAVV